jgi:hypothetical protein
MQESLEARAQLQSQLDASQQEGGKLGQQVQALAAELARHRDALQQEKLSAASLQVRAASTACCSATFSADHHTCNRCPCTASHHDIRPCVLSSAIHCIGQGLTPAFRCGLQLELQRVRTQLGLAQTEKELLQAELAKASGEASSSQLKWSAASREAGHLAALQPRVEELQQQVHSLTAELELSKKQVRHAADAVPP